MEGLCIFSTWVVFLHLQIQCDLEVMRLKVHFFLPGSCCMLRVCLCAFSFCSMLNKLLSLCIHLSDSLLSLSLSLLL